eukprot:CAMPEP_0204093142 /NCGR_PEP_ID=MMETSP0360-20130528/190271_1 /ASSEMBLY_ACC=CAM_ASM_000342 /TAXON_ID=268821 /ORGANISM="Scrippsiella Hangoei, Strain SHTV-5" /LENGTH=476 /DNA_ID=CAMNT_0051042437 /DNA_START=39 /DNA_END=1470 /DNA_ORIENTATION=+
MVHVARSELWHLAARIGYAGRKAWRCPALCSGEPEVIRSIVDACKVLGQAVAPMPALQPAANLRRARRECLPLVDLLAILARGPDVIRSSPWPAQCTTTPWPEWDVPPPVPTLHPWPQTLCLDDLLPLTCEAASQSDVSCAGFDSLLYAPNVLDHHVVDPVDAVLSALHPTYTAAVDVCEQEDATTLSVAIIAEYSSFPPVDTFTYKAADAACEKPVRHEDLGQAAGLQIGQDTCDDWLRLFAFAPNGLDHHVVAHVDAVLSAMLPTYIAAFDVCEQDDTTTLSAAVAAEYSSFPLADTFTYNAAVAACEKLVRHEDLGQEASLQIGQDTSDDLASGAPPMSWVQSTLEALRWSPPVMEHLSQGLDGYRVPSGLHENIHEEPWVLFRFCVFIHGLKSQPDLNGRLARVQRFHKNQDRWAVTLLSEVDVRAFFTTGGSDHDFQGSGRDLLLRLDNLLTFLAENLAKNCGVALPPVSS